MQKIVFISCVLVSIVMVSPVHAATTTLADGSNTISAGAIYQGGSTDPAMTADGVNATVDVYGNATFYDGSSGIFVTANGTADFFNVSGSSVNPLFNIRAAYTGLDNLGTLSFTDIQLNVYGMETGIQNSGIFTYNGTSSKQTNLTISDTSEAGISNTGTMLFQANAGSGSAITIRNISSGSNLKHGIFSDSILSITNMALTINGVAGYGIYNAASGTVNFENGDIDLRNISYAGIHNSGTMNIRGTAGNTLTLAATDSSSLGFTENYGIYNNGKMLIENMSIIYDDSAAGADSMGIFTATNGELEIKNSTLDLNGNDKTLRTEQGSRLTLTNSSLIMRSTTGFTTLTVGGDYAGNNSTIYMNAKFGEDGSNDQIIIQGTASGTTILDIVDTGSSSAIESSHIVVLNDGGHIPTGAFRLAGGVVDTGAYEYYLHQDANGSYYLGTEMVLTDFAKTVGNEPLLLTGMVKAGMNSLMKRMGELHDNNREAASGMWVRSFGNNMHVKSHIATKMNILGVELGYDHSWDVNGIKLYLGAMVGYMSADSIKTRQTNGARDGRGSGTAYSAGVYATLLSPDDWFVDIAARHFWEDVRLTGYAASGTAMTYKPDRQMTAYSVEAGKRFTGFSDSSSMVIVEPKVEVMYAHAAGKTVETSIGNRIRYGKTESFTTKGSVMLAYAKTVGEHCRVEPYVQAGVIREWAGTTNVRYNGAAFKSRMGGTSFETGGGVNATLRRNLNLYGEVMYETGGSIRSLNANVGVRLTF